MSLKIQNISKKIDRKILLNPGPATTSQKVKESLIVADICPREKEFGELIEEVSLALRKVCFANEDFETVLLGSSGTGAIESCLTSCLNPDSNEKILIIENGAYGRRMVEICDAYAVSYDILKFNWLGPISIEVLKSYLNSNKGKYRVAAFVHHETTTGLLNPLYEICEILKEHNIKILVDAMSSYAGIFIDQTSLGIDYLISSSNKCIQGMAGIGIVIASKRELELISKFKKRNFYFDLSRNFDSQKRGGQFAFTPPVQVLYSLSQALSEFKLEGGVKARSQRYEMLYEKIHDELVKLGFKPVISKEFHSKILTSFYYPSIESFSFKHMHDYFYSNGITLYPGKIGEIDSFRVSNLGDLNIEDIDYFLDLMKEYSCKYL
jgi:2-aminoethylphosphonate-pyruvate transaminase